MIALFHKNKFVNFWHNDDANTENWMERTCNSLGFNKDDVKICKYNGIARSDVIQFDENCDAIKFSVDEKQVTDTENTVDSIKIVNGKKTVVTEPTIKTVTDVKPEFYAERVVLFSGSYNKDAQVEPMEAVVLDTKNK